jgi:crotonobetainyl-CoA:carnitine CoA-transferase CaiB-like acyl-CoA transferase
MTKSPYAPKRCAEEAQPRCLPLDPRGAPDLVTNPDYATGPARSKNRDALNAAISACTEKRTTDEWVNELNAAGVPCGPIYSVDQIVRR